jgi:hypothetical protein
MGKYFNTKARRKQQEEWFVRGAEDNVTSLQQHFAAIGGASLEYEARTFSPEVRIDGMP